MEDGFDAAAGRIRGSIKEAIGMLIGDPVVEAEGAAEKAAAAAKPEDAGTAATDDRQKS